MKNRSRVKNNWVHLVIYEVKMTYTL